jgi:hypothetical protein
MHTYFIYFFFLSLLTSFEPQLSCELCFCVVGLQDESDLLNDIIESGDLQMVQYLAEECAMDFNNDRNVS